MPASRCLWTIGDRSETRGLCLTSDRSGGVKIARLHDRLSQGVRLAADAEGVPQPQFERPAPLRISPGRNEGGMARRAWTVASFPRDEIIARLVGALDCDRGYGGVEHLAVANVFLGPQSRAEFRERPLP